MFSWEKEKKKPDLFDMERTFAVLLENLGDEAVIKTNRLKMGNHSTETPKVKPERKPSSGMLFGAVANSCEMVTTIQGCPTRGPQDGCECGPTQSPKCTENTVRCFCDYVSQRISCVTQDSSSSSSVAGRRPKVGHP